MANALALASAVCFGATDFIAALLSRRVHSAVVALVAQLGGTVLILVAALVVPAPSVTAGALGWGALSGIGTGIGVAFLFRGMGNGQLSVVVPLSDVAGVVLPVLFGVLLLGERPSVLGWLGIAVAAPALWLVTHVGGATRTAVGSRDGLVSGIGFALQFIALVPVDPAAGLWPLVASRVASVAVILPMAVTARASLRTAPMRGPAALAAVGAGALGTLAIVLYTLATREQLVAVAVVLTALYPVIPVLLGLTVLRERVTTTQTAGSASPARPSG
ncbi:EamA family transporter [Pseudonocardia nigra]|uniref:EamA family transporter n=1 Tax=Pseudonocardia nigra TaxID=1921578 RepID=UPI001C5F6C48|nr:EamA family transporter [Pseudonocardia nigra]